MRSRLRFPALALGVVALALGLWAGLVRLGWGIPVPTLALAEAHAALMVDGVLATLIGVERAVALERRAFYLGPVLTAAGPVGLALGAPEGLGLGLLTAGSAVLFGMFAVIYSRDPALYTATQLVGAGALVLGNALGWAGEDVPFLVPWWATFLVLLIAAERLELTRVFPMSRGARGAFVAVVAADLAGCAAALVDFSAGTVVLAASWVLLAGWLAVYDVARRNLGRAGLPRFTAVCLLTGYAWLAVAGALLLGSGGLAVAGLRYDAQLHALFLGFVLSMVFAHAPILLPAVLGQPLAFRWTFYLPVVVLVASVAGRVAADLDGSGTGRAWAGLFNVVAIGLFGLLAAATYVGTGRPDMARSRGSNPYR